MNDLCFYNFMDDCDALMRIEEYDLLLDKIKGASKLLPNDIFIKREFELMVYESRVYTERLDVEACVALVKNSHSQGYAFPLDWQRYAFLKAHREFLQLKATNDALTEAFNHKARLAYEVEQPSGTTASTVLPTIICFHGDGLGCNLEDSRYRWQKELFLEWGYRVVYLQSDKAYCHNSYGWLMDVDHSALQLEGFYEDLKAQYAIDEKYLILAGFSGGASTAIAMVAENVIPAQFVVALCPGDHLDKVSETCFSKMGKRGVMLSIFEGGEALDPVVPVLLERLTHCEVNHTYEVIEALGHAFPKNWMSYVQKSLSKMLVPGGVI